MAISQKKPSVKLTAGAQYICFNEGDTNGDFSADAYETDVIKLPTVVNVEVSDNTDSYDSYASGAIYDSDAPVTSQDITTEQIAFPAAVLARMRGDTVDEGVILGAGISTRPWFAYGFVVKRKDGSLDLRWYPKCKLTENTDATATSTESHSDQTDTTTIRTYGFDENQNKFVRVLTETTGYENVTEEAFFAAPILSIADAKKLKPTNSSTNP